MTEPHDPIEGAWQRVLAAWDEAESHRKFLALCASLGRLDAAGTRYRAVKEGDPARAAEAARQIDRLFGLAMQSMTVERTEPPVKARRLLLLLAIVLAVAMVGASVWAWLGAR